MRIHFLNRGHAERCLKSCIFILEIQFSNYPIPRPSVHRLRNAFCQGLGYSSYEELVRFLSLHPATDSIPNRDTLLQALTKGFRLSFELVKTSEFRLSRDMELLAGQFAQRALLMLMSTEPGGYEDQNFIRPVLLYRRKIEGRRFLLHFGVDGPGVSTGENGVCGEDGVVIGVSSVVELTAPVPFTELSQWNKNWGLPSRRVVVKYADEIRIDLSYLSERGILEFSQHFGVPISERPFGVDDHGTLFFQSPAFLALGEWAKANPHRAERIKYHCPYIPTLPEKLARLIGTGV